MIFDLFRRQAQITESSKLMDLIMGSGQTDSGVNVTTDNALRVTAVYACVLVISETLAQLPLILYRRDGANKSRATAHRLYTLLHDAPNEFQTSFDWRMTNAALMCLRGRAYAYVNRSLTGEILELLPMHPDRVEVTQNKDYSLRYTFTDADNQPIPLDQNQVFRLTGLSFDGINGVSPIAYHRQTIGIAMAAEKHSALAFKNGAKMSGILKHPHAFKDDDVAKRVRESWDEAFSGDNAYKTPLLEDGLDWQQVSMTNKDAQYIETRKFQVEDIARIFRVPPHKIGHLEKSTNNNIEHQGQEFVTDTMMPWLKRWEQSISRDLMTPTERREYYAEFLVDGLMRGDMAARAEFYSKAVGGPWMLGNEARGLENMNPLPGLDEVLKPLNMTNAGDAND